MQKHDEHSTGAFLGLIIGGLLFAFALCMAFQAASSGTMNGMVIAICIIAGLLVGIEKQIKLVDLNIIYCIACD